MCKTIPVIAGILVGILALWPSMLSASAMKWILVILALVMIAHPFMCKVCGCCCGSCEECEAKMPKKKGKK